MVLICIAWYTWGNILCTVYCVLSLFVPDACAICSSCYSGCFGYLAIVAYATMLVDGTSYEVESSIFTATFLNRSHCLPTPPVQLGHGEFVRSAARTHDLELASTRIPFGADAEKCWSAPVEEKRGLNLERRAKESRKDAAKTPCHRSPTTEDPVNPTGNPDESLSSIYRSMPT